MTLCETRLHPKGVKYVGSAQVTEGDRVTKRVRLTDRRM